MPDQEKKKPTYDSPYHMTEEEHWLAADKRLRRLGVDPDLDPAEIYHILKERMKKLEDEKAREEK